MYIWSPTQLHIAVVSTSTVKGKDEESVVEIWDVITGSKVDVYQASNRVNSLIWSPDGKYLILRSAGQANIWDIAKKTLVFTFVGNRFIEWTPDSLQVAFASQSVVGTWNVAGKVITYYHPQEVTAITWSPDGKFIDTGCADHTVRIWDVNTGNCLYIYRRHSATVNTLAVSPDGALIASADFVSLDPNRSYHPTCRYRKMYQCMYGK